MGNYRNMVKISRLDQGFEIFKGKPKIYLYSCPAFFDIFMQHLRNMTPAFYKISLLDVYPWITVQMGTCKINTGHFFRSEIKGLVKPEGMSGIPHRCNAVF